MRCEVFRSACLVAASVLVAGSVRGEVRLETRPADEPEVQVIDTFHGPWSPTGGLSSVMLNPDGDIIGDSQPGWSARSHAALAAWYRPALGTIELAIGSADAWTTLVPVPAPGVTRHPQVASLDEAWGVAWQQHVLGDPRVFVTWVHDSGAVGTPIFVAKGVLVGIVAGGTVLHVIVLDPVSGDVVWYDVHLGYVPTQPIPIEARLPDNERIGNAGGVSALGTCDQCAQLMLQELTSGDDGGDRAVLSWWPAPGTVRVVLVTADGPQLPGVTLTSTRGEAHPPRLMQQAMRDLGLR